MFKLNDKVVVYDVDQTSTFDLEEPPLLKDKGVVVLVGENYLRVDTKNWPGPSWYSKKQCRKIKGK